MSTPAPHLRYHSLHVETDYLNVNRRRVPYDEPLIVLSLATDAGNLRNAHLTRAQVLDLIEKAAQALARTERPRP